KMPVQRADLSRNSVRLHCRLYCSTPCMAENKKEFDSKDSNSILETCDDLRRHHVAGNASDKDVSNRLIKNEFHRDARIGTSKDRGKGLLFVDSMLFQDGQIVRNGCQLIGGESLIA